MKHRSRNKSEQQQIGDGVRAAIATQLRAVMGDTYQAGEVHLVGSYEIDRASCEAAIREAQAGLDEAGEGADEKESDFDLAWKWHVLDEALIRLAHVESRMRLARRRAEVAAARARRRRKI